MRETSLKMSKALLAFSLMFTIACLIKVDCLDLETEIQRQKQVPFCGSIQPAPHVDLSWLQSTQDWYYLYWTKLELLLTSKPFLSDEEYKDITEEKALKEICFRMNFNTGDSNGYGKQLSSNITSSFKVHFNPVRHGVIDVEIAEQYALTAYLIMTDNKTYAVWVDLFPDGTRGGYVVSTDTDESKFSEAQVLEWKTKLVEVGFREGDFLHTPLECNKILDANNKITKDTNEGDKRKT